MSLNLDTKFSYFEKRHALLKTTFVIINYKPIGEELYLTDKRTSQNVRLQLKEGKKH